MPHNLTTGARACACDHVISMHAMHMYMCPEYIDTGCAFAWNYMYNGEYFQACTPSSVCALTLRALLCSDLRYAANLNIDTTVSISAAQVPSAGSVSACRACASGWRDRLETRAPGLHQTSARRASAAINHLMQLHVASAWRVCMAPAPNIDINIALVRTCTTPAPGHATEAQELQLSAVDADLHRT